MVFYGIPADSPLPKDSNILHHLSNSHAEMQGASANLNIVEEDACEQLGREFAKFNMDRDILSEECAICLGEFHKGSEVVRMQCFCLYHETCVRKWWDKKDTVCCPSHMPDSDDEY